MHVVHGLESVRRVEDVAVADLRRPAVRPAGTMFQNLAKWSDTAIPQLSNVRRSALYRTAPSSMRLSVTLYSTRAERGVGFHAHVAGEEAHVGVRLRIEAFEQTADVVVAEELERRVVDVVVRVVRAEQPIDFPRPPAARTSWKKAETSPSRSMSSLTWNGVPSGSCP